jgi:hypothetical protein
MIDWDKPIETEDGRPAKVISRDYRTVSLGICMMVQIEEADYSHTASYTLQGDPAFAGPKLRNRKTKREGWINIYAGLISCTHSTEALAKMHAGADSKATIKIEWEE